MHIEFNKVTWYSRLLTEIIFLLFIPILAFVVGRKFQDVVSIYTAPVLEAQAVTPSKSASMTHAVTFQDPMNGTYNIDDEAVTLSNGSYDNGNESIMVFGKPVFADLEGRGQKDAVFFVSKSGEGTGLFTYVVAAENDGDGTYSDAGAAFIGDRISPQNIAVKDAIAAVNYADRKSSEPFTAEPSVGVTKYFKIVAGQLQEVTK